MILKRDGVFNAKEYHVRRKNGEQRTVLMSSQLIRVGGEEFILTSLLDITERNKAEEALKQSERSGFDRASERTGLSGHPGP